MTNGPSKQPISESWQKQIGIQTFPDDVLDHFHALFDDPNFVADAGLIDNVEAEHRYFSPDFNSNS